MLQIERNKSFMAKNVLSLRKKVTQAQANDEMSKIAKLLEEKNVKQNGPVITATFDVDTEKVPPLLDMEILVPMDRQVNLPEGYRFKNIFHIVGAVHAKHSGSPAALPDTYNELLAYIKKNNLQQITAIYNVYTKSAAEREASEALDIDVYIGVNPSIL